MNNDLPPSSKFEKCVMRNKESSLLGLMCETQVFVWRSEVINNLRAGMSVKQVYKAELMVVASAEWEQKINVLCKLPALLHLLSLCCYNAKPSHELTPAHVITPRVHAQRGVNLLK